MDYILVFHTMLCAVLGHSAWCRLVKMGEKSTYLSIRLAFTFAAMAACILLVAPWASRLWPWFPDYQPHLGVVLMLAAFVAVQVSTSRHWKRGVPRSFIKE